MFVIVIATAFDWNAPLGAPRAIIRRDADELEMIELAWDLQPALSGDRPFRFVRAEWRAFATYRCLISASAFHVTTGGRRYRFALEDHNWFYLAGMWRPSTREWPKAYAIVTVAANAEVTRYQDRQGAVLRRSQRMAWLDLTTPADELLQKTEPAALVGWAAGTRRLVRTGIAV